MNWIQKHALSVLMRSAVASLKEMRPEGVDSNLFSYHIHYLKSNNIIEIVSRGQYQLTAKGMRVVGKFGSQTGTEANDVKAVIVLYSTRAKEVLLFKWSRHPYFGVYTLPHDRYDFGSSLQDALTEAVHDKLGITLEQAKLTYCKSGIISIFHDEEQISCMSAHVYTVDSDLITPKETRNGTLEWIERDTIAENIEVAQGLPQLIAQIEDDTVAMFESNLRY